MTCWQCALVTALTINTLKCGGRQKLSWAAVRHQRCRTRGAARVQLVNILPKFSWRTFLPKRSTDGSWILGCVAVVIILLIVSGIVVAQMTQRPGTQLTGSQPPQSLEFNPDTSDLDEELIRAALDDIFPPDRLSS